MSVGWQVRVPKAAVNSQSSVFRASVEFSFTPKRWITVLRSEAALTFEAFGLSCVTALPPPSLKLTSPS
jgi:hypothetical protein